MSDMIRVQSHSTDPILRTGSYLTTFSGVKFYPMSPSVEDIRIEDIAHALSNLCRYVGHCREFYSVAQHSILVSRECKLFPLWGLLHDAAEAYIGDISRPLKRCMISNGNTHIRDCEENIMRCVADKFGLGWPEPEEVKCADNTLLTTEIRDLLPKDPELVNIWGLPDPLPYKIRPVRNNEYVRHLFIERFEELTGTRIIPIARY